MTDEKREQTKGAAESLVKCHVRVLGKLNGKFGLKLNMVFMPSVRNKADVLTRVKNAWLGELEELKQGVVAMYQLHISELKKVHDIGMDRTLYLARKIHSDVTRWTI